jgi:hypothetical protein
MAKIPIKEKSGFNWLWIILVIVVLALLAWWFMGDDDNDDVSLNLDNDTAVFVGAGSFMVGESVNIMGAEVTELIGDMSFMINHEGRDAFVVFNQERTPNDATEGEYDINVGNSVDIRGTVRAASSDMPRGIMATVPAGMNQYIYADSLNLNSRSTR